MKTVRTTLNTMESNMSCFADCASECLVMRVPYTLAVKMLDGLNDSDEKRELFDRMSIAARRSKKFSGVLNERRKQTHPKIYNYCMTQLGMDEILSWLGIEH